MVAGMACAGSSCRIRAPPMFYTDDPRSRNSGGERRAPFNKFQNHHRIVRPKNNFCGYLGAHPRTREWVRPRAKSRFYPRQCQFLCPHAQTAQRNEPKLPAPLREHELERPTRGKALPAARPFRSQWEVSRRSSPDRKRERSDARTRQAGQSSAQAASTSTAALPPPRVAAGRPAGVLPVFACNLVQSDGSAAQPG